jgi:hypothetical protein
MGPAGEINSNVADMSKYLLFHMNHGKVDGKQLLSGYGMGFFISTDRGQKQVSHGGNIDGISANLAFLPDKHIGVVVLTNLDGNPVPAIVTNSIYDRLLGLEQVPWNQRLLASEAGEKKSEQEAKDRGYSPRKLGTHPSHDLKDYVGDYSNPGYGIVTVDPDGDKFKVILNKVSRPLEHYHYDIFQTPEDPLDPYQKMKVQFDTDLEGDISSISMPLQPDVKDIVFARMPDRQLTQRCFIEGFTGDYEIQGSPVPLKVSLRAKIH